jgi:poly(3-hydroxybutyrate) depolymerase
MTQSEFIFIFFVRILRQLESLPATSSICQKGGFVFRVSRRVSIPGWMALVPLCSLLVSCGGSSQSPAVGGSCNFNVGGNCTLIINGVTRTYLLHLPSNFQANVSALVIGFHGSKGSGSQFEADTGLSQKSDQVGFAAVYPDGLPNSGGGTSWNIYLNSTGGGNPPDDSGFTRQLILTLEANLHPNPKKIYVTGFSAAGYMAQGAAIDNSDLIAAAGVVEGSLSVQNARAEPKYRLLRRPPFPCSSCMGTRMGLYPTVG